MADTRADVKIQPDTWTNLYSATGITVGTAVGVYNKGSSQVLLVIKATAPTSKTDGVPLWSGPTGSYASIPSGASGLWAYSAPGSIVSVQE